MSPRERRSVVWLFEARLRRFPGALPGAVVALISLTTGPLPAQEPAVRAYLESTEVEVGERFHVIIEVTGVTEIDDVFIPPLFLVSGLPRDGLLPSAPRSRHRRRDRPGGRWSSRFRSWPGRRGGARSAPSW